MPRPLEDEDESVGWDDGLEVGREVPRPLEDDEDESVGSDDGLEVGRDVPRPLEDDEEDEVDESVGFDDGFDVGRELRARAVEVGFGVGESDESDDGDEVARAPAAACACDVMDDIATTAATKHAIAPGKSSWFDCDTVERTSRKKYVRRL